MKPTKRTTPAVVIGVHTMQGLQTARLLRQRGVPVVGVTFDPSHPFNRTRYCQKVVTTDDDLAATLRHLGPELGGRAILVPAQDWAVREISRNRADLDQWYDYALPPPETVELLMDKATFQEHAEVIGLPVPESRVLTTRAEAEEAAVSMIFPCVLKPSARSSLWSANTSEKAFELPDGEALLATYDRVSSWVDTLVVQQWVVGTEQNLISVNGYFDADGVSKATFVARKIRQWPVRTGQSSLGVECRNDDVLDLYHRLFASVDYHGLAYLEVKEDERTGQNYLIEPNIGRPTGRSAIAEAGGVELLDTMYCDIAQLPLPAARQQTYGQAKWIHLRRDMMASATMIVAGEMGLADWWKSMRGPKFFAVWDRRDPWPFVGEAAMMSGRGIRQILTRVGKPSLSAGKERKLVG